MKTKICTSIEQSKKLLELGLDADTADMHYWTAWAGFISKEKRVTPIVGLPPKDAIETYWIPAWSLSTLLELLPTSDFTGLDYDESGGWFCQTIDYVSPVYDTPIDAAYDVVVNLVEQGYIKTEKKCID